MTRPTPVPPANLSPKGPGDAKNGNPQQTAQSDAAENPDKKDQQGNIKQNTTHQGYQQDR